MYLGCWTFYSLRASCNLFKKKKKDRRVLATKPSLTVMNCFTPLEGFPSLIVYANILSPSLLSTPLFSKPQNPLTTQLFAFHFTSQHPSLLQYPPTPRRCQHCLCGVGNNTLPLLLDLHQIRPDLGSSVRSPRLLLLFPPSLLKKFKLLFNLKTSGCFMTLAALLFLWKD